MKSAKSSISEKITKAPPVSIAKKPGAALKKEPEFNIHIILPPDIALDSKNIKVTIKGLQVIMELGSYGGENANQVQGVRKLPVPPRPHKELKELFDKTKVRFTLSKKQVR